MQAQEKEEFRNFLERSGVVDGIASALVKLYETQPRPNEPLTFVKSKLSQADGTEAEMNSLREHNLALQNEVNELKARLASYEAASGASAPSTTPEPTPSAEPSS